MQAVLRARFRAYSHADLRRERGGARLRRVRLSLKPPLFAATVPLAQRGSCAAFGLNLQPGCRYKGKTEDASVARRGALEGG